MSEKIDISTAIGKLLKANNILIISHKNPDGDTIGSAGALFWALRAVGKTTAVFCSDAIPSRYNYMQLEEFSGQFSPEYIVSVDIAGQQLFGENSSQYANKVNLSIDHHGSNTGFAEYMLLDASAAATCEIIYELIVAMGVAIDPRIANCLYTGLSTDTGCFQFTNTTARTHRIAARIIDLGADIGMLNELLFENKSKQRIALEQVALASLEYHFNGKCALVVITRDQIDEIGVADADIDGITSLPRSIEGIEVGVTMRQQPSGSYKISVRTKVGLNACDVCTGLGGGGHTQAAGCEIIGGLEYAKEAILYEVKKVLDAPRQEEPTSKQKK